MFWVRIRLGRREYLEVLDTRAIISIAAHKMLPRGYLKNIMPTAAIRIGEGMWFTVVGTVMLTCLSDQGALPICST